MRFRQHQDDARRATRRLLWLFILTVTLTVLAVNAALALAWGLGSGMLFGYPRWFFETNTAVALGFILGGGWLETLRLREGGAHVATLVGGREILRPANLAEQRFRNVVDEMAIASGLKTPRIFVLDREEAINAFAAGWEQQDSVVTVTRGALERLTRDELQGVVAHEFSHILHGDTRLNMRLIGYVYGLQLIFNYGRAQFDMTDAHHRRGLGMLPGLALMAAGSTGWLAGRLLKAAVSRQREFLADASAIQYTRQPAGIGNALRKIAAQVQAGHARIGDANAELVSHLMLSSTIFERGGWLATHPPLADRLARIFGRPTAPLPADVLHPETDVASTRDEGVVFFTSDTAPVTPVARTAPSHPAGAPLATADPEPVLGEPRPAAQDALQPLLGYAMPDDLISATLAFLVRHDAEPEREAWRQAVAITPARESILRTVWALPPTQRLPWMERLLTRCEALASREKTTLRRHAHHIVASDRTVTAGELLTCLLIDHLLGLQPVVLTREVRRRSLQDAAPSIQTFTALLATQLAPGTPPEQKIAWVESIRLQLALPPAAPHGRADLASIGQALRPLQELSAVMRPALLKAWLGHATVSPLRLTAGLADALRMLCLLIDTPLPPALLAWYGDPLPSTDPPHPENNT